MSDVPNITPEKILSESDKGDEMIRRVRFQLTVSAIFCLNLLDFTTNLEEVYCEHHEDILLKMGDGRFHGIQVKTREQDHGAFEANDQQVKKSIIRFIALYKQFPGKFLRFTLLSNVGFYSLKPKSHKSLAYIISLAKEDSSELRKTNTNIGKWLKELCDSSNSSFETVLAVLKMIELSGGYSTLGGIHDLLISKIAQIDSFKEKTILQIKKIADEMLVSQLKAASKYSDEKTEDYFVLQENPSECRNSEIIAKKLITKQKFQEKITDLISLETVPDISSVNGAKIPKTSKGDIMRRKMTLGGISAISIVNMQNQKFSAEGKATELIHKYDYDPDKAEKVYDQIKQIVLNLCAESYDLASIGPEPNQLFGTNMLIEVRKRIKARYDEDQSSFFGFKYEHLLGIAGVLTEECTVWWSKKIDLIN